MQPMQRFEGRGISLTVLPTSRFKAGMLSMSAVLPITEESACLAPLLLSVLRRGTERYPTLADINRRLDSLWGTGFSIRNFYRGDRQVLGFSAELLDGCYLPDGEDLTEGALELMTQLLFHPVTDENGLLCERYVESEKELQRDAIRASKNNPRSYAGERFRSILFEGKPCGLPIYGSEEQTMAVTPASLTAFWKAWIRDLHLDFFYVGGDEPSRLMERLQAAFGGGLSDRAEGEHPSCLVQMGEARDLRVEETLYVSQSHLLLGFTLPVRLTDRDYPAATVMNELLGNSPISRLFVYVREKKSLCYACSSTYSAFTGTLRISCGLKKDNRDEAEQEILSQIACLQAGDFTEGELLAAKRSLVNAYRQTEDSPPALESYYYGRSLAGYRVPMEECRRQIEAVTREDVIRVANQLTLDVTYFLEGTAPEDEEDEDDGTEI